MNLLLLVIILHSLAFGIAFWRYLVNDNVTVKFVFGVLAAANLLMIPLHFL